MFIDTSGFLCLFDEGDLRYEDAKVLYGAVTEQLTHSYVLAELVPLCHRRGANRRRSLEFVSDLLNLPKIEVVWVDEMLHRSAVSFLQSRLDKTYSLCDAVSFLLMRQYGITDALSTDHHFEQEAFVRLLRGSAS